MTQTSQGGIHYKIVNKWCTLWHICDKLSLFVSWHIEHRSSGSNCWREVTIIVFSLSWCFKKNFKKFSSENNLYEFIAYKYKWIWWPLPLWIVAWVDANAIVRMSFIFLCFFFLSMIKAIGYEPDLKWCWKSVKIPVLYWDPLTRWIE